MADPLMILVSGAALPAPAILLGAASLGIWLYLLAARGGFSRGRGGQWKDRAQAPRAV